MAEKIKAKRTITGAQQYSSPKAAKKLVNSFHKDMKLVRNDKMTEAEFKKKYGGKSISEVQIMVYAIDNEEDRKRFTYKDKDKDMDEYALELDKDRKKVKRKEESDRGRAKGGVINRRMGAQDYRKGGLTLNTVDNRKKK